MWAGFAWMESYVYILYDLCYLIMPHNATLHPRNTTMAVTCHCSIYSLMCVNYSEVWTPWRLARTAHNSHPVCEGYIWTWHLLLARKSVLAQEDEMLGLPSASPCNSILVSKLSVWDHTCIHACIHVYMHASMVVRIIMTNQFTDINYAIQLS